MAFRELSIADHVDTSLTRQQERDKEIERKEIHNIQAAIALSSSEISEGM